MRLNLDEIIDMTLSCVRRIMNESEDPLFGAFESEEEKDEIERLIDGHNSQAVDTGSYYIISVTGRLGKYYTLYLFSKPVADFGRANPFIYKGNLSQKFGDAVRKVVDSGALLPIKIEREEDILSKIQRYRSQVFHSGKYQGMSYEDVYASDPKYILWYYDKLKEESQIPKPLPYGRGTYTLSKAQREMYENLRPFVETYHQEQAQRRRETIDSVHVEGGRAADINATIIKAPQLRDGMYGAYVEVRCQDGNRYYIFNAKPSAFPEGVDLSSMKGASVRIQSAESEPTEIYGVKYNKLRRVKGLEIIPSSEEAR